MLNTLKGKISLIYLCLVTMIAVVGAVSGINLYGLTRAIDGLMTDNYKSINAVFHMLDATERQDSAMLIYINVERQKGIDLFTENSSDFLKWYNVEYYNITESGEKEHVERINNYYKDYLKLFSELQEIRNREGVEKAVVFYNSKIMPDFIRIKQELRELSLLNEKSMFNEKVKATRNARQSMYITLILSAVTVIGGFSLSLIFTGRFLMPIYTLTRTIKSVKEGDLNQQINISTHDEVGELAQEFNNMTKRLQQYEQSTLGKLMEEKNKSLAIVKSISDPLIVLDVNCRIMLINNACENFFSIQEERVLNKHFLEAIRNGELFDHVSSIYSSDEDYKEKIILINSEDDYYFNVIVTTVKDLELNTKGIIVALQNVTELKKLERIKTDFVATISHEFKTPLTSIIMGTSMITNGSLGAINDEQETVLNAIEEDGMKLSDLVNELLELSKIESDRALYNIQPSSILGIIENAMKRFYSQAQQKYIKLYYELNDDMPRVKADFEKITWVLNNLLINALKYTDANDEICVSAYTQGNKMFVSVKDTGLGIPLEFQKKIFDKFVQVKDQDIEARGTGLGLSIVKGIIEAHGGQVWCKSKVDVGSEFIFTLPLYEEED